MSKYIDVELELPKETWKLLSRAAERENKSVDELVNDILLDGLEIMDEDFEEECDIENDEF